MPGTRNLSLRAKLRSRERRILDALDRLSRTEVANDHRARTSWAAFRRYHLSVPHIWTQFERFTLDVIRTGRDTYSAHAIVQRIRWYTEIERGEREFKISNTSFPFYARLFMAVHPQHDGFFRTHDQSLLGVISP